MYNHKSSRGLGKTGRKLQNQKLENSSPIMKCLSDISIRKLARQGGVKRISNPVYKLVRLLMVNYLKNLIQDAIAYSKSRNLITPMYVVNATKRHRQTFDRFN